MGKDIGIRKRGWKDLYGLEKERGTITGMVGVWLR